MASERAKKVSEEWFQTDTYRSPTFEEIIDKALQEERREAARECRAIAIGYAFDPDPSTYIAHDITEKFGLEEV